MLTYKVAVVTGASKGIGMAVAGELAAEDVRVVAGARSISTLMGLDNVAAVVLLVSGRTPTSPVPTTSSMVA